MFTASVPNQLPIYIGKEVIEVREIFFDKIFVRHVIEDFIESQTDPGHYRSQFKIELGSLIVHTVHGDHVSVLPQGATNLAYSDRTENEIWMIDERVLCIQSHPEFNASYIEELIINKMYDVGKMDDMQKDEVLERLYDNDHFLTRNVLNLFIFNFLFQTD